MTRMISPDTDIIPAHKHSSRYVNFTCDCGNKFTTQWKCYTGGSTKSCGRCKLFRWKSNPCLNYGEISIIEDISKIDKLTDPVYCLCSCGTKKMIKLSNLIAGTKSCGCIRKQAISRSVTVSKADVRNEKEWIREFPQLIPTGRERNWGRSSNEQFNFRCQCSNIFSRKFFKYTDKSTCRHCFDKSVKKGDIINGFVYDDDLEVVPTHGVKRLHFVCKCGKRNLEKIRDIFGGLKSTCNKCNEILVDQSSEFGKLRVKEAISIKKNYGKKVVWICRCTRECAVSFHSVWSGKTRSCGRCKESVDNWYIQNADKLQNLTCPVSVDEPLIQFIRPLETIHKMSSPFRASCPICTREHRPRLSDIIRGVSLTCGCTANRISIQNRQIADEIRALGYRVLLEYVILDLMYDVGIPDKKIVVEYQGQYWHSSDESRNRDMKKIENAIANGYRVMIVEEQDWKTGRNTVMDKIRALLETDA